MTSRINLDERILEQIQRQDIRERLNLPLEQSQIKTNLDELLKAAQDVICGELVNTGYDESELIGLRLEYALASKESEEPQEIHSAEWYQPSQETDSNKLKLANTVIPIANNSEEELDDSEPVSSPQLPVSIEFLDRLAQRLDDAIVDLAPKRMSSKLFWSFRSAHIEDLEEDCLCQSELDGRMYKGRKNEKDGSCTGSGPCGSRTNQPPTDRVVI